MAVVNADDALITVPRGFRWQLLGDDPPAFALALRLGEAIRTAMLRGWMAAFGSTFPNAFYRDSAWLPEDIDGDGRIDHMLLLARTGIPAPLIPLLAQGGRLRIAEAGQWQLQPVWMGRTATDGCFASADRWVSQTPYVTPLDCVRRAGGKERQDRAVEKQVTREVTQRYLSQIHSLAVSEFEGFRLRANASHRVRFRKVCKLEITFTEKIAGPLAFGYAAHLGLGLMRPA